MKRKLRVLIKSIPFVSDVARFAYRKLNAKKLQFENSGQYWEERYAQSGDSGDGSYGRLAAFKAEVINEFVEKNSIGEVVELGCGDGAQLKKMRYEKYIGIDVSVLIVEKCRLLFKNDLSKAFFHVNDARVEEISADLALSLDVVYHLVEDDVFDQYMKRLFKISRHWVVIYSSNFEESTGLKHVKHRKFTDWISKNEPFWSLHKKIDQIYPYVPNREEDTSFADFYIYEKKT